jgi:hypothetical protein
MTAVTLLAAVLLATRPAGRAQEVQAHGLMFEQWARAMFFDGCLPPGCTQKWDIPAAANRTPGGLPVNPKAAKYRTPVDLGDALRQFDINEPFIFVIGYWRQEGGMKCFVNIVAPPPSPRSSGAASGVRSRTPTGKNSTPSSRTAPLITARCGSARRP